LAKHWLQRKFNEFFIEVERQKAAVQAGRWAFLADDPVPFDPSRPGARGPNPVWQAVRSVLDRQAAEAGQSGASGLEMYKKAQYAMAALADEVFMIHMKTWPGRDGWISYPLQKALFNTVNAGDELFDRIDELLARKDPGEKDLAEVYFNVLSLGFRGKHASRDRDGRAGRAAEGAEDLRRRLLGCFAEGRPRASSQVSPRAYEALESRAPVFLPSAAQSLTFLGIVVGCLLLATLISGRLLRKEILESVERINKVLEREETGAR